MSWTVSRIPLALGMTVVCTPGVVVPPPAVTSGLAVAPATVASDGIDVSADSPVVDAPVLEQPSPPVGERVPVVEFPQPPLSEPSDLLPVVEVATVLPFSPLSRRSSSSSSQTLAWGEADDSSPPFSPNCVQAGRSQDVPDEGSLFNVSPLSPGIVFRPSKGDQSPPAEGVLLPTTLDDFIDSVLGDPIMYARCEQFPGSESPLSLPVYAWLSGSAYLLEQTLLHTVLASGASSQPEEGPSAVEPPMDLGDGRLLEKGLLGCPYQFSESMVPGVRRSTGVGSAPRLFANVLGGSAGQRTSDGSCRQPAAGCGHYVVQSSDTVTVRHGVTQDVIPNDGLGHRTVVVSTGRGR